MAVKRSKSKSTSTSKKGTDPTLEIFSSRYSGSGLADFIHGGNGGFIDDLWSDADFSMDDDDLDIRSGEKGSQFESGDALHIGIDSEWVFDSTTNSNIILSYQYCMVYKDRPALKGVIYTDIGQELFDGKRRSAFREADESRKEQFVKGRRNFKQKGRWTFEKFIAYLIQLALDSHYISSWCGEVFIYAHFLRADFASFSDCFNYAKEIRGVKKTFVGSIDMYGVDAAAVGSKRVKPTVTKLYDKHRNVKRTVVNFIDTMLLAPNQAGLASVGGLIGLPKLAIPRGYDIARMDLLLAGNADGFEAYALRDAEIALYYGLFMQVFVRVELGLKHLPSTLAGIGLAKYLGFQKAQGGDVTALFGNHKVTTSKWNKKQGKPKYLSCTESLPAKDLFQSLATHCYMGGRNECFSTGVTPIGVWNDFDVTSAYTVAMLHLKPLDFSAAYMTKNPLEFTCQRVGIAYISFEFPEHTRFPCLPVQSPNGLIYPLRGEAYVCAAEIEVAIGLGCSIEIKHGVIVPFVAGSEPLFLDYVRYVRDSRKRFEKKSLMELLFKEMGNSLYGKTAQGLKEKGAFEVATGLTTPLSKSLISCPYLASYISGLIRALVSEQVASIPEQYSVLSVTTDGFLTNAPMTAVNFDLPASRQFTSLLRLIDDTGAILECKHRVKQLAMIKTRGQLTVIKGDTEIITAKCSVKPDCAREDQNEWMLDLYFNRVPGQKVINPTLISMREMFIKQLDLIELKREVAVNLEPDFKRKLSHPVMHSFDYDGKKGEHIYCESVPWRDLQEFMLHRTWFDGWRVGSCVEKRNGEVVTVEGRCLKTLEDYNDFVDFFETSNYLQLVKSQKLSFKLSKVKRSYELARRLFLNAFVHSQRGLECSGYKEVAQWFCDVGYPTKVSDFDNAKRSGFVEMPKLPLTPAVAQFLDKVAEKFPNFELHRVVDECLIASEYSFVGGGLVSS